MKRVIYCFLLIGSHLSPGSILAQGFEDLKAAPSLKRDPSAPKTPREIDPETQKAGVSEKSDIATVRTSKDNRGASDWMIFVNYSYFDLLLPSKTGLTGVYQLDSNVSYEAEYMQASISIPFIVKDLGSFDESRIAFTRRSFLGTNSFSLFATAFYNKMELNLGNRILSQVSPSQIPFFEVLSISTMGVGGGIGNRWSLDCGFNFGVDWISWLQPLYVAKASAPPLSEIKNENDRKAVDGVLTAMTYFPRFVILKFQVGWAF